MGEGAEKAVAKAYHAWKQAASAKGVAPHPDEETISAFLEGTLGQDARAGVYEHLILCSQCMAAWRASAGSLPQEPEGGVLELLLALKDQCLEVLRTTGDVLVGQEVIPGALLRARQQNQFKGELTVMKDLPQARLTIKCEPKAGGAGGKPPEFSVTVSARHKVSGQPIIQARISLFQGEVELESYLCRQGVAVFEHLTAGAYRIDVAAGHQVVASVSLEVKA